MTAQIPRPVRRPSDAPAPPEAEAVSAPPDPRTWADRLGRPPRGPLLLGLAGVLLLFLGSAGAGGALVRDPVLSDGPLGFWRYGHGTQLATGFMYLGLAVLAWAWIKLGRLVLARAVGGRAVLSTALVWLVPMAVSPLMFTRDVFSYLAQGALPLAGYDPYAVGPEVLDGTSWDVFATNVHYFWQDTPAPYGPLFILLAKGVAALTALAGNNMILGVIGMKLVLITGLALLVWALPELTRRMGGRVPVALWVTVANPVMVVHMVGGGHNDLMAVGLLAAGALFALRRKHLVGIALVTLAMAVKASAAVALPFLVLIWAGHLTGTRRVRFAKAAAGGIAVFLPVFALCSVLAGVGLGWLPALSAPSMIVNWLSLPTGLGELVFNLVNLVADPAKQPFINVARIIGALLLLYYAGRKWWGARDGGPPAVHAAGCVLLAVALLSPATLPWYLSWGMALLAMGPWTRRGLQILVAASLWLSIVYYPNGEAALYNWPFLIGCALLVALAVVALYRVDPLGIGREPAPAGTPVAPSPAADPAAAASAPPEEPDPASPAEEPAPPRVQG